MNIRLPFKPLLNPYHLIAYFLSQLFIIIKTNTYPYFQQLLTKLCTENVEIYPIFPPYMTH